jgi:hypothetical protein
VLPLIVVAASDDSAQGAPPGHRSLRDQLVEELRHRYDRDCGVSCRRSGVPASPGGSARSWCVLRRSLIRAAALHGQEIVVVGGGNSAGQAAVHLARHAARVTMVFRRDALTATMSDYLVRAIAGTSNIKLRTSSEVIDGGGAGHLEWVTVRHGVDYETLPATALTDWLLADIQRDPRGYLLTGTDAADSRWPLSRPPMFLETSVPGQLRRGRRRPQLHEASRDFRRCRRRRH